MQIEIGHELGNFRITARIGRGGMGDVFRAEHKLIGNPVAVKVLHAAYSKNKSIVDRFANEARAASAIEHPGIVRILDFGHYSEDKAYIVMEYLDGESLEDRIERRQRIPCAEALPIVHQIASALAAAHDKGIVHRDLKPDNVMIIRDPDIQGGERIKLLDFGVAKLVGLYGIDANMTRAGTVLGTPTYMAPEQCDGPEFVNARSDLYSLGCVFFRMLCGRPPFVVDEEGGPGAMISAHLQEKPPAPRELTPTVPPPINDLVLRLLAKKPENRPESALTLMREIELFVTSGEDESTTIDESSLYETWPYARPSPRAHAAPALAEGSGGDASEDAPTDARFRVPPLMPRPNESAHRRADGSLPGVGPTVAVRADIESSTNIDVMDDAVPLLRGDDALETAPNPAAWMALPELGAVTPSASVDPNAEKTEPLSPILIAQIEMQHGLGFKPSQPRDNPPPRSASTPSDASDSELDLAETHRALPNRARRETSASAQRRAQAAPNLSETAPLGALANRPPANRPGLPRPATNHPGFNHPAAPRPGSVMPLPGYPNAPAAASPPPPGWQFPPPGYGPPSGRPNTLNHAIGSLPSRRTHEPLPRGVITALVVVAILALGIGVSYLLQSDEQTIRPLPMGAQSLDGASPASAAPDGGAALDEPDATSTGAATPGDATDQADALDSEAMDAGASLDFELEPDPITSDPALGESDGAAPSEHPDTRAPDKGAAKTNAAKTSGARGTNAKGSGAKAGVSPQRPRTRKQRRQNRCSQGLCDL